MAKTEDRRKEEAVKLLNQVALSYPNLKKLHVDSPYGAVVDQFIGEILKIEGLSDLTFSGDVIFTKDQLSRLVRKRTLRKLSFACP